MPVEARLATVALHLLRSGFDGGLVPVLEEIGTGLHGDRCHLALCDSRHHIIASREWRVDGTSGKQDDLETAAAAEVNLLLGGDSEAAILFVPDTLELPNDVTRKPFDARSVKGALIVPLVLSKLIIGVLSIETIDRAATWSEREIAFVTHVAELLAQALQRQREEDELHRLALAVTQSPVTVIITDPDGVIEYVNPKFAETSGYTVEETIGKTLKIPEHPSMPKEVYREIWQTIHRGDTWRGELINQRKDGSVFWEMVSISPTKNVEGSITHYIAVKEDISERMLARAELEQARDEADQANRTKSEFLANMSHEVRTPVNAIIGMSHLVLQTDLTERQRDYLTKIRSSSQSLLGIINSILDYSNIDAGRMSIDAFDFRLEDVLDNLRDLLETKARDKGLKLSVIADESIPGAVVGDPFRLGQVLMNLGNNAIKFTEEGHVSIVVETVELNDEQVTLSFAVRDTGIGLSDEQIARLFRPFTQIDGSTTRAFGGTGLGLAIAKRLIEMMGGEMGVRSRLGEGSDFHFTLDLKRQSLGFVPRLLPHPSLKGMRVLVVDDSRTSQTVLCETLESFSFSSAAVSSGEAALLELEKNNGEQGENSYRVVLMDWKMPSMDGLEVTRRIKNHPTLKTKPAVILITGYGREDVIYQADKCTLDGFLLKPVNPSLLYEAILTAVGPRELGTGGSDTGDADRDDKQAAAGTEMQGCRVLVVEDNPLNQEVAEEILVDMGLTVFIANNGREAVEAVHEDAFDLVLMDVQMPVMDGFEATAEIRREPRFENLPIIAMTAHAMTGDRERCLAAGMDDYTSKPIDTEHLFEVLSRWITPREPTPPAAQETIVAAGDEEVLPVSLSGINLEAGLNRVGGNRELFRKLLQQFFDDHRSVLETVRTALQLDHRESGLRILHTLKGVAATIGAEGVHVAARELEACVKNRNDDDHGRLLATLDRALTLVFDAIASMESGSSAAPKAPGLTAQRDIDLTSVIPLLTELNQLLQEGNPEASELLGTLASQLAGSAAEHHVQGLEHHIESFDFDDAVVALRDLSELLDLHIEDSCS